MEIINQPHAMFFEKMFSRNDIATDFIQNYLPESVVNILDMTTLHLEKKSFISNEFRPSQSDLLYRIQTKDAKTLFVYFLLEHKSYLDRWVMLQLLLYILRICETQHQTNQEQREVIRKNNEKQNKPLNAGIETEYLYPILPVVFYHGEANWNITKEFSDLFHDGKKFKKYLPDFTYEFVNTADFQDEEFKGSILLKVVLMAMKHFFMDDFEEKVPELLELLSGLIKYKDSDIQFLEALLRYLGTNKKHDIDWLKSNLKKAFKHKGDKFMNSIADTWIEKGIKQGVKQGVKKGVKKGYKRLVAKMMASKFNVDMRKVMPRLNPLPSDDIMELGTHLLTMQSSEDAYKWINARKKAIKMA